MGGVSRVIAPPFVAAAPAGARVVTRLRVSPGDEAVLRAAGLYLGSLAGRDLAARCREGRLDAEGRAVSRRVRKRSLTPLSSSRWAGAITRVSEDQYALALRNLGAEKAGLRARVRATGARLTVPAGIRQGKIRGYATRAERYQRIETGSVSVVRGGRRLLRARGNLDAAGLTEREWRERWDAARMFLTADFTDCLN